jgi:dipeptidyl aminopeptidase/acylaminoacyl peptidase
MRLNKITFFVLFFAISIIGNTQEKKSETIKLNMEEWLVSNALIVKMPASNDDKDINGHSFSHLELLKFNQIDLNKLKPTEGDKIKFLNSIGKWKVLKSDKKGFINLNVKDKSEKSKKYKLKYLISYLEANRWLSAKLNIESSALLEVYLDGKPLGSIRNIKDSIASFEKNIQLEKKNYTLIVKILYDKDFKFKANIEFEKDYSNKAVSLSTSPKHYMDIEHVLEGKRVKSVKISADGEYYIVEYSEITAPKGKVVNWFEIYKLESKKLIQTIKGLDYTNLIWRPSGHAYSYLSEDVLWLNDLSNGSLSPLITNVEISSYKWADDASFIIYSVSEKSPDKNKLAHKLVDMQDRWPWFRTRSFLYKFDVKTGLKQRLTFGNLTTDLHDIKADGSKIIYSESKIDNTTRPYTKQYVYELDLNTLKQKLLWKKSFDASVSYSPDGKKLLVTGSPILFGNLGKNVKKHEFANDYDIQAYIYNLSNGDVKAISINFNPAIEYAYWKNERYIYFKTTDRSYVNLYKYDLKNNEYSNLDQELDIITSINFSKNVNYVGFTANGISTRDQGFILNLKNESILKVVDPENEFFKNIKLGVTEDWVYTKKDGTKLGGFIYYPPNFNPTKKYPMIVYYYAGTSPIDRNFRGRYPKHLYAAHGYVVYVVNPSGAVGYGQEFSAAHVNNWGTTVADEIIEATKTFTKKHSFIDDTKVGCMGASYGGFMTMLLMTRTDIFATAISHAGISSISSYWGEGYWGYLYSATATANNFPWNNKKLYVEQSPLFNADKVVNPMLLLHGSEDTNVPIGESLQMYAALKLLGKPVEMVQILGQDHLITDFKRRVFWQKTIAAWFDKHLKNEPQWWKALYPETNLK